MGSRINFFSLRSCPRYLQSSHAIFTSDCLRELTRIQYYVHITISLIGSIKPRNSARTSQNRSHRTNKKEREEGHMKGIKDPPRRRAWIHVTKKRRGCTMIYNQQNLSSRMIHHMSKTPPPDRRPEDHIPKNGWGTKMQYPSDTS